MTRHRPIRIERTPRGARLVQDDVVLSEVLAKPGATHTLFDVLAACIAVLAPGSRVAMLGFAGGGVIAPLRAMDCPHRVDAVDLSRDGQALFRELSGDWAGEVRVAQADAARWLRRRAPYDLILEDLSTSSAAGVVKPYLSFDVLPGVIRDRLRPGGVAVTNLLPLPGTSWASLEARVSLPHASAVSITLDEYENHVVAAGDELPTAAAISRRLRRVLRAIRSSQADKLAVRTLHRG